MERIRIGIARDWDEAQYVWLKDGVYAFSATPDPLAHHVAQHAWNTDKAAVKECLARSQQEPEFLVFDEIHSLPSFNGRPHPEVRVLTDDERGHFAGLVHRYLRELSSGTHTIHEVRRYSFTES